MSDDAKYIFCYSSSNDAWDDRYLIGQLYDEFNNCSINFDSNLRDLHYQLTWEKAKRIWHYKDVLSQFKASLIYVKYDDEDEFIDLYEEDVFKKLLDNEHPLIRYREVILEQSHKEILHGASNIMQAQNNNNLIEINKTEKAVISKLLEKSIKNYTNIQEPGLNLKDDPMDSLNLFYKED